MGRGRTRKEVTKRKGIEEIEEGKKKDVNIWSARPLSLDLKEYCAVDTAALFPLLKILKKRKTDREISLVLESSDRYGDYFRSYESLPMKEFIWNPFLPSNIIQFSTTSTGDNTIEKCRGCRKNFKKWQLSASTLANQASVCGVCKKVESRAKEVLQVKKWLEESE